MTFEKIETIVRTKRVADYTQGRVTILPNEIRVVLEYEDGNEEISLNQDEVDQATKAGLGAALDVIRKLVLSRAGFEEKVKVKAK